MSEITTLFQQAEQQVQTTLSNLDGAVQFVLQGENKHPNRIDICKQGTPNGATSGVFGRDAVAGSQASFANPLVSNPFSSAPTPQANPFGGATSAFGQPSALGQKPNPFGSQPSSAFGQPSAMGASKPVFGQSTQMGANTPAFGQASSLGQKPNPFSNAASSGQGGFGQVTQSAFGQPSTLGQRPNPFGAPAASSTPPAPNPFSQPAASNPNPFGQPAVTNPFSQVPSMSSVQPMDTTAPASVPTPIPAPIPATNNPFGQPSTSTSAFSAPARNPFGAPQPSGFGAATSNPFAQVQKQTPTQLQSQPQPQAQQMQHQQMQHQATAASLNRANPYGPNSTKQHPAPESYIAKTANGRITSFNGQPVMYKWKVEDKYQDAMPDGEIKEPPVPGVPNADGTWRKILFPNGPPGYNKDTEPDPAMYTAEIKAAYATMTGTGRFEGDMPEVPPMREDCVWNF